MAYMKDNFITRFTLGGRMDDGWMNVFMEGWWQGVWMDGWMDG